MAQLAVAATVSDDLPLVLDVGETFYFKPESGRLWLSPHDETPSAACDAAPEEIDVALGELRRAGQVVSGALIDGATSLQALARDPDPLRSV